MPDSNRVRIMDAVQFNRTLNRMAHEILEKNKSLEGLALVGIRTRGVPLARRLAAKLAEVEGVEVPVGTLDINLYRDDLTSVAAHPVLRGTEVAFPVDGATVVLVDDVLYTGRTIRSALNALMDLGRPSWIQLAVLVDRGHRELPIRADFTGKTVSTRRDQHVDVRVQEEDGKDAVHVLDDDPEERP
jgi:pyrimidine operon attenuation protein/uracil phosphoribosyltransferase